MTASSEGMEKKVDEEWKAQVDRERDTSSGESQRSFRGGELPPSSRGEAPSGEAFHPRQASQADWTTFISSLSMQAMMALGEIPHPATNVRQENLEQAKYLIDILGLLKEKTEGNLSPEEAEVLENVLYELRMKFAVKELR